MTGELITVNTADVIKPETMEILKKKLLNNSEIARAIGISPVLFRMKLHQQNFNKFSEEERIKIINYLLKFFRDGIQILENGSSGQRE